MNRALVGIIMGSESDIPVMKSASDVLLQFEVAHEVRIVSAHRTVHKMISYGEGAKKRGLEVIIAGAGGAAHLPGMIASLTPLPVIGVPIRTSSLDGVDSLLSIRSDAIRDPCCYGRHKWLSQCSFTRMSNTCYQVSGNTI